MKGIVFTEFIELVEDKFSPEIADAIIETANLPSGGAYTALGTYDHQEILQLVTRLSEATDIPASDLMRIFGRHLFNRFIALYPQLFVGITSAFEFLSYIESYIHVEVKKLYPDAQLPAFEYDRTNRQQLIMTYHSSRPFALLAEGLIDGCLAHFGEKISFRCEDLSAGRGTSARFILTRV